MPVHLCIRVLLIYSIFLKNVKISIFTKAFDLRSTMWRCRQTVTAEALKPGFHYPSWRPELTARVDGWPVSITRQHGPCWRARVSTSRVEGYEMTIELRAHLPRRCQCHQWVVIRYICDGFCEAKEKPIWGPSVNKCYMVWCSISLAAVDLILDLQCYITNATNVDC